MTDDKPIHVSITVTKNGNTEAYERWITEKELEKLSTCLPKK